MLTKLAEWETGKVQKKGLKIPEIVGQLLSSDKPNVEIPLREKVDRRLQEISGPGFNFMQGAPPFAESDLLPPASSASAAPLRAESIKGPSSMLTSPSQPLHRA